MSTPSPTALPATPAEGLWTGTTATNRIVTGLVLDDGSFWLMYSPDQNLSFITGAVHGETTTQSGNTISSNAKDLNVERPGGAVIDATLSGDYTTKETWNGTILDQTGGKMIFTTTYDPDYENAADINAVAGTYIGPVAEKETATVTVVATELGKGELSGVSATGCQFTGSVLPRKRGNVFNVTITFGLQDSCGNKAQTVNGVAFYDTLAKKLYSAALNDDKTNGSVFFGTRKS